jgi:two-component system phosphate regulon response regulator PhoB
MSENNNLTNKEIFNAVQELDLNHKNQDGYSVLLIDDDKWIHRVVCHYLRNWGFSTLSAFDPIEGIAMAVKHRPVLILLDIVMPDVKGDVLLKMLKKIDLTSNIPIIIISGNLNTEILGLTYRDGAMDFISKPIKETILFEKVKAAITPDFLIDDAAYKNVRDSITAT